MQIIKRFFKPVSIVLLVIAVVGAGMGMKQMSEIRPADAYIDKGVYEFVPYKVFSVRRENSGAIARERRRHPTKIVYVLQYRAVKHSGYKWDVDTAGEYTAKQQLAEKQSVQRRVLSIKDTNRYLTVETELTAESYTNQLRYRYVWIIGCSILYIVFFAFWIRKRIGW